MSEVSTCGSVPNPLLTNELRVTCPKGTKGDRLQISKKGETKLNLMEVEIEAVLFGSQPGETIFGRAFACDGCLYKKASSP